MSEVFDPRGLRLYARPRPGEGYLERICRRTGNFALGVGLLMAIASLIAILWLSWQRTDAVFILFVFVLMMVGLLLSLIGRVFYFVCLVEGHANQVEARLTEKESAKNALGSSG